MNYLILVFLLLGFFACKNQESSDQQSSKPPNILLILVDDMGYGGISSFGQKPWKTPNIDQLAEQGMKFTHAYAAPVCSPTRAAILTGRTPARVGITNWIPGWAEKMANPKLIEKPFRQSLPLEEYTIAEALKNHGYSTALVGKWHLGDNQAIYPDKQGFDYHYVISHSNLGTWFVDREGGQINGFHRQDAEGRQFLTDHLAEKANHWLEDRDDKPWFLFFSTHVVHKPIAAKNEVLQKYLSNGLPEEGADAADYAAMHEHMDLGVGRVLNRVKELGQEDNTVVIFLSDNGGRVPQTVNTPFRGGKGELLEGGIRVPLIVKWPGTVAAGTTSTIPTTCEDLFPTILDLAGLDLMPEKHRDGHSLKPVLTGQVADPESTQDDHQRALFWHYPHYTSKSYGKPSSAIRKGKWKLLDVFEFDGPELYDLESDPGEATNLANEHPEMVESLMAELNQWREQVGAKFPEPNPDYDPSIPSGWPEELAK